MLSLQRGSALFFLKHFNARFAGVYGVSPGSETTSSLFGRCCTMYLCTPYVQETSILDPQPEGWHRRGLSRALGVLAATPLYSKAWQMCGLGVESSLIPGFNPVVSSFVVQAHTGSWRGYVTSVALFEEAPPSARSVTKKRILACWWADLVWWTTGRYSSGLVRVVCDVCLRRIIGLCLR
jgi:hypothetical protein